MGSPWDRHGIAVVAVDPAVYFSPPRAALHGVVVSCSFRCRKRVHDDLALIVEFEAKGAPTVSAFMHTLCREALHQLGGSSEPGCVVLGYAFIGSGKIGIAVLVGHPDDSHVVRVRLGLVIENDMQRRSSGAEPQFVPTGHQFGQCFEFSVASLAEQIPCRAVGRRGKVFDFDGSGGFSGLLGNSLAAQQDHRMAHGGPALKIADREVRSGRTLKCCPKQHADCDATKVHRQQGCGSQRGSQAQCAGFLHWGVSPGVHRSRCLR